MLTLVTGATGEVGRRFVPRLLARTAPGDAVRVLVRDEERGAPAAALGAQVAVGELRDPEAVRKALAGVDTVLNIAAAFRGVPDEEAWAVNRDAALELGRGAVEAGAGRFVQVSTNLVYGAGRGRPAVEDDEPLPGSPMWGAYPASKSEAEQGLLALHREHGLDVRIGRLAFVYGEGDPHLAQSLRWAGGWAGHQRLTMVHHADVAQGLFRLLRAGSGGAGLQHRRRRPGVRGRAAPAQRGGAARRHGGPAAGRPVGGRGVDRPHPRRAGVQPRYPSVWTAWDAGAL